MKRGVRFSEWAMNDFYHAAMRSGWKSDEYCEEQYCYNNRASERFCDYHRRLYDRQDN